MHRFNLGSWLPCATVADVPAVPGCVRHACCLGNSSMGMGNACHAGLLVGGRPECGVASPLLAIAPD